MDYKEQIKLARDWYNDPTTSEKEKVLLFKLFPEVTDSEDDRIRKKMLKFFKSVSEETAFWDKSIELSKEEIIDWLEKIPSDMEMKELLRTEYEKGKFDALEETKQEWSEEDENMIYEICSNIKFAAKNRATLTDSLANKQIEWLKSLRPQNKYAYNPYKAVVESIAEMCKHYDKASHSGLRDFYDNIKVKCKDAKEYDSLYPQNTWKPSDEQMEVLLSEVTGWTKGCPKQIVLESLYNDLKKLK